MLLFFLRPASCLLVYNHGAFAPSFLPSFLVCMLGGGLNGRVRIFILPCMVNSCDWSVWKGKEKERAKGFLGGGGRVRAAFSCSASCFRPSVTKKMRPGKGGGSESVRDWKNLFLLNCSK
mmetsp:Transcript_46331/g.91364  ORF Transcript_46331/g.91364 Transcript_46331/m.91364 type:complete len:120 (+) Transcript_46331:572-931(+)